MTHLQRSLVVLSAAFFATACSDTSTGPEPARSAQKIIVIAAEVDPTLVTFNAASCSLSNSFTGAVSCSWNIANPALHSMNLWAQAVLTVNYDCVNPKNGRIASSETRELDTLVQFFGVADASLTGSNVSLPLPFLPTDLSGKEKKLNACRGNGVASSLNYTLDYWDVSVITVTNPLRFSCFGSDNRLGCLT